MDQMFTVNAATVPGDQIDSARYLETDWEDMFAGIASPAHFLEDDQSCLLMPLKPQKRKRSEVVQEPLDCSDPLAALEIPQSGSRLGRFRFRGKKIHLTYPSHLPMELLKEFLERLSPLKWYVVIIA